MVGLLCAYRVAGSVAGRRVIAQSSLARSRLCLLEAMPGLRFPPGQPVVGPVVGPTMTPTTGFVSSS
jgi:hypothetical protein